MNASTIAIAACLLAGTLTSAQSAFRAQRVIRTGHFSVDAVPEKVFPLFTPLGELHWAAGWKP